MTALRIAPGPFPDPSALNTAAAVFWTSMVAICAAPVAVFRTTTPAVPADSWVPPSRSDGLLDAIPPEIPVVKAAPPRELYLHGAYDGQSIDRKNQTSGALAPLWLTVRVPAGKTPVPMLQAPPTFIILSPRWQSPG